MITHNRFSLRAAAGDVRRRGGLRAGGLLLAVLLAASCSKDDAAERISGRMSPLTFSAAVAEVKTRSTTDNVWSGNESVAVECDGTVKTYTAAADGTLTAADPFYWTGSDDTKQVRAWYCGDDSTGASLSHATAVPTEWSVAADQSGDGFQKSDLLFAPQVSLTYTKDAASYALPFYHQTAKVNINIKNAEVVTSQADIVSVTLGEGNMAVKGAFTAPESSAAQGTWQATESDGTVSPRKSNAPAGENYVASYSALVIPQTMDGKAFICITVSNGTTYRYTPGTGDAQLTGGVQYTYNITVKGDRLDVEAVIGGQWTQEGEDEDNIAKIIYTESDLKPGDYFYSDGTTSDGGLRSLANNGDMGLPEGHVKPIEGKTVIGIVICSYKDFPERFGRAEIQSVGGTANILGMVMAVQTTSSTQKWCNGTVSENLTDFNSVKQAMADISGLERCNEVRSIDPDFSDYPAFQAACVNFNNNKAKAPANTSGWFLPSAGQWYDIVYNLGAYPASGVTTGRINSWFQHIKPHDKTYPKNKIYTSTQSKGKAWDVMVGNDIVTFEAVAPEGTREIRPILVFGKNVVK